MDSYRILNEISAFSMLIPFGVMLMNFSFYTSKLLCVALYILWGVTVELYVSIDTFIKNFSFVPMGLFIFLETLCVTWIYYFFIKDKNLRTVILFISGLYIVFSSVVLPNNLTGINNVVMRGGSSLVCITLGVFYFIQLSKETTIKTGEVIIGGAFLFYFVTTTAMFSFMRIFNNETNKKYWIYFSILHLTANGGLNFLLALGLYKWKKQS